MIVYQLSFELVRSMHQRRSKLIPVYQICTALELLYNNIGFNIYLTRTSRNQKGKVAQGMACQRQEKGEKREAFPTATFPPAYCSRMWLECSIHLQTLELSHGRTAFGTVRQ
jgi:hypothetical protein